MRTASTTGSPPESGIPAPSAVRVLFVGDSEDGLPRVESALDGSGVRLILAQSADEALSLLQGQDCALALIEIRKPGLEIGRRIREAGFDALPLVFLASFNPGPDDIAAMTSLAPSDFLSRPLHEGALRIKVEGLVALHRAHASFAAETARYSRREREHALEIETLLDSVPGALFMTRDGSRHIVGNAASYEILGMKPGQNTSKSAPGGERLPYEIYRRGRRIEARELPIQQAAATGEPVRDVELEVRRIDGEVRVIYGNAVPILDESGAVREVVAAFSDITALRRVESSLQEMADERLRAEHAKFRLAAIVESSDDAIVSKTLEGIITSWNAGARRMFGYEEPEVLGRSITILIPPDRIQEEQVILGKIGRGEKITHYETIRRRKDGGLIDVSITVSPIRDAEGRIVGASKIAREITEEKRAREEIHRLNHLLEERVRERTASLEEMVRELNTFAYTVAHDLRAPLRAIHGFGQLLTEEYGDKLGGEAQDWLRQLIAGSNRMDQLIRDLLEYTRVSRDEVRLGPVDLDEVVAKVLSLTRGELTELGAQVRVESPLGLLVGHATTLGQALTNLVSNAAKFVPPGRTPRIRIRSERIGVRRRIWVEDNGLGIEPEHRQRIFKLFERLHPRESFPGTGIGLAIVWRAVERMGGEVGVESVPGEGSRFFIDLPAADVAPLDPGAEPG